MPNTGEKFPRKRDIRRTKYSSLHISRQDVPCHRNQDHANCANAQANFSDEDELIIHLLAGIRTLITLAILISVRIETVALSRDLVLTQNGQSSRHEADINTPFDEMG